MTRPAPDALIGDLLRDVAIAWRALASYPPGHPTATEALGRAHATLGNLLAAVGPLELGAGRDTLLWQERHLSGPTAAKLAELLRKRSAAGVTIEPGVDVRELETFLRALLPDARRAREAGSLERELEAAGVTRIRAHDLDFSAFSLVEGAGEEPALPEAGGMWEKLVRRLVAGGQLPGERLAAWIAGGGGAVGLLAALLGKAPGLAEEDLDWARETVGAIAEAAAIEYASSPDPDTARGIATLRPLLGDAARARFDRALVGALRGHPDPGTAWRRLGAELGAEAVAELRAAGERPPGGGPGGPGPSGAPGPGTAAPRQAPADPGAAGSAPVSAVHDATLIRRVRELFARTDLDAASLPAELVGAAEVTLEVALGEDRLEIPQEAVELASRLGRAAHDREVATALAELALQPALELEALEAALARLEPVLVRLLLDGRLRRAQEIVARCAERAETGGGSAAPFRSLLGRLAGRDAVHALVAGLEQNPVEHEEPARRLIERLGPSAVDPLLELLAETESRSTRHRLLHLLTALGASVVHAAVERLSDPRWFVVRNMLVLLRRIGDPGSVPAVRRCAEHPDLRVRLEAIRNLFAFDDAVPRELLREAIANPDPRLAEEAVELAGARGIVEAAGPLVELLQRRDRFGRRRALRLKAIEALGELGQTRALEALRTFAPRRFFARVPIEESRALYRTLGSYPAEARRWFVERGRRARDPEIRRLAAELAGGREDGR